MKDQLIVGQLNNIHKVLSVIVCFVTVGAAQPVDTARDVNSNHRINLQLPVKCDNSILLSSIDKSMKMSKVGVGLFWAGLGLQLLSPVVIGNGMKKSSIYSGVAVLTAGTLMTISAPIVSCLGGDKASKAMISCYPDYEKHNGWNCYIMSNGLLLLSVCPFAMDMLITNSFSGNRTPNNFTNTVDIVAAVATVGILVASGIFYIKSVYHPYNYCKEAKSWAQSAH
jgi:hypothetical protein